jgi:hypothetical protein
MKVNGRTNTSKVGRAVLCPPAPLSWDDFQCQRRAGDCAPYHDHKSARGLANSRTLRDIRGSIPLCIAISKNRAV